LATRIALTAATALFFGSAASAGPNLPATPSLQPGEMFRECRNCPEMVVIPSGAFTMGSPDTEKDRFRNEGPQHRVTISHAFALAAYPVTVREYRRFVRATGRPTPDSCRVYDTSFADHDLVRVLGRNWQRPNFAQNDNHPVVCITFDDARTYIAWLNREVSAAGGTARYRLPSEAEWEYAARGGTATPFYWGSEISRDRANYGPERLPFGPMAAGADRWLYTSPVGAFPPNPFGLYDMAGNVWQFTEDCWRDSYEGAPSDGSPRGEAKCDERVVRGGSWFKIPTGERSAKRGEGKPVDLKGAHEIGFRVARDLP
jgi:formylglycine-generating enzyme required for sulfatase activity